MKINEVEISAGMYSMIDPSGTGYNLNKKNAHLIHKLVQQGKFHDTSKETRKVGGGVAGQAQGQRQAQRIPIERGLEDGSVNHLKFLINSAIKQGWIESTVQGEHAYIQLNVNNTTSHAMNYLLKILTKFKPSFIEIDYSNDADQVLNRSYSRYQKAIQDLKNKI